MSRWSFGVSDFGRRHPPRRTRSSFVHEIFDLMDELGAMDLHDDIRRRILEVTARQGITMFAVSRLPQPRLKIAAYMLMRSWPQEWLTYYDARSYYRHDPIATACFATVRPFIWSTITAGPLSDMERRIMKDAHDIGMINGLSVPIVDINGFQAVVSMAGRGFDLDPDGLKALHLLSLVAFETAERISGNGKVRCSPPLSVREQEVLQYAASGLSQRETAERLGISVETTITHTRKARVKLGAANVTHAVVKALQERQIRL